MATLTLNEPAGRQVVARFLDDAHQEGRDIVRILNGALALLEDGSARDPESALTVCEWLKERIAAHTDRIERAGYCIRDNDLDAEIFGDPD